MPGIRPSYTPRLLRKFESIDTLNSFVFPLINYEWESTQELRAPNVETISRDYLFDYLGTGVAFKGDGVERLRFGIHSACDPLDIDEEVDNLRSVLFRAGLGKGWTTNRSGDLRWAYMRIVSMPSFSIANLDDAMSQKVIACVAEFRRESDWFAEDQITKTQTITASPTLVSVTNPGTLTADKVVIRIRANAAGGFTNPKIVNSANTDEFETARDSASSNSEVKLDTSESSVEYSNDNGSSYTDDFGNYVLPPVGQVILSFRLEPGVNSLSVTCGGTPNFDIEIAAEAPYA